MSEQTENLEALHDMGPLTEGDQQAFDQLQTEVEAQEATPAVESPVSADRAREIGGQPVKEYVTYQGMVMKREDYDAMRRSNQDTSERNTAGRQV